MRAELEIKEELKDVEESIKKLENYIAYDVLWKVDENKAKDELSYLKEQRNLLRWILNIQ